MKIVRSLAALALSAFAFVPLFAQSAPESAALGLVAQTTGGKIGDATASEGASVFSGDYLSTPDNGSMLVRMGPLSLQLQSSTSLHIYRATYGAVVELKSGTVAYTTPGNAQNIVIVASDVRVTPLISSPDFGTVSLDDPCSVTVHTQRGEANVQVGSENRDVQQGKAYRVRAENQLSYRKYLSPDADDYHEYHEHHPCAALDLVKGRPPIAAGQSRFLLVSAALIGTGTGIAVWKSLESEDRP
jgi:hypothetical protein